MRAGRASISAVVAATLALALARGARGQDSDPVPPGWLEGAKAVLGPAGCSIEAPASDWIWQTPKKQPPAGVLIVFCQSPDARDKFVLQIHNDRFNKLKDADVEDFLIRYEEAQTKKGYRVDKIVFKASDVPLPGRSFRFCDELLDPSGKRFYSRGYMTTARRLYLVTLFSTDAAEPDSFVKFAQSFEILHATTPPTDPVLAQKGFALVVAALAGAAGLLLTALVVFVVAWRRKARDELDGGDVPAPPA